MQNVKGTYDYFGKEQALRRQVQATLREKFELYDFDEMVTTELTGLDFLTAKYAGGDEIIKEMYQLTDQGGRRLGGLADEVTVAVIGLITLGNPTLEEVMDKYGLQNSAGALEVLAVQDILRKIGLAGDCVFDPFLSRGLSFYTGTVYEIFDAAGSFSSSLGGGGRYDAVIGQLVGREDTEYGAAGLSLGMESIMTLLENRAVETAKASVVLIPVGVTAAELLQTAAELRASGIRVKLDTSGRKLKNILASVANSGVRYALLLGETEWNSGLVHLKDMDERIEREMSIDEAIYVIADK